MTLNTTHFILGVIGLALGIIIANWVTFKMKWTVPLG